MNLALVIALFSHRLLTRNPRKWHNQVLSYKEQRELEQLPQLLEELEEKITALQAEIGDPHFFQQAHDVTDAKLKELADTEAELETAFMRWEELEEKKTQAEAK